MEKKTLAEIMAEPATVETIIKKAMEINELLLKVENMPELKYNPDDYELRGNGETCYGCCFLDDDFGDCLVLDDERFNLCLKGGHFEKKESEVSSFNDVE